MMAWLTPRMVAGIDAADSAASPAVMPGMMRKGMPASASAMASSPPRPNMQGSPPFSRSTRLFWRASSINRLEMSACCADGRPPRLPAYSSSRLRARERQHALADQRVVDDDVGLGQAGERVERQQPGSPGPAPASQTWPGSRIGTRPRKAASASSLFMPGKALSQSSRSVAAKPAAVVRIV